MSLPDWAYGQFLDEYLRGTFLTAGECWFCSYCIHEKLRYRAAKVGDKAGESLDS